MTKLIAVAGSAPGIGKSTICALIERAAADAGLRVQAFAEEDIRTRSEFAHVWNEFERTGVVPPRALLDATSAYVDAIQTAGDDLVVTDALIPFTPSLFAFGESEATINRFLTELRATLSPVDPVLLYLDGDPVSALLGAAEREGPGWLSGFVAKVAGYRNRPEVHDLKTTAAYLRRESDLTLRLLSSTNWPLVVIPDVGRTSYPAILERIRPVIFSSPGLPYRGGLTGFDG